LTIPLASLEVGVYVGHKNASIFRRMCVVGAGSNGTKYASEALRPILMPSRLPNDLFAITVNVNGEAFLAARHVEAALKIAISRGSTGTSREGQSRQQQTQL
jgi:hypothetical protein